MPEDMLISNKQCLTFVLTDRTAYLFMFSVIWTVSAPWATSPSKKLISSLICFHFICPVWIMFPFMSLLLDRSVILYIIQWIFFGVNIYYCTEFMFMQKFTILELSLTMSHIYLSLSQNNHYVFMPSTCSDVAWGIRFPGDAVRVHRRDGGVQRLV